VLNCRVPAAILIVHKFIQTNTFIIRWKKYWLYGELVQIKADESSKVSGIYC
jgi:hypothetical protein